MIKVSFQGERGAYSEAAAKSFFSEEIETIPCPTFADALQHTNSNETDHTILPVENSLEGSVGESYDLLYSSSINAVGEIYYKIEHCLIGDGKLEEIKTVYSHPQALGQCREFLQKHHMKTVPTYDTAGSVKIVKEMNDKEIGCIASKSASQIYNVPIIAQDIADNSNNFTRFLILSKKSTQESGKDKTSIMFSIKHEPGTLYEIIENFQKYGVNLTKIESRPKKTTAWEYNFFVDFEGHSDNAQVKEMLDKIKEKTIFFKILGSYPSGKLI